MLNFKREKNTLQALNVPIVSFKHIAENTNAKYIMFTNCTSPMIKKETFIKIIEKFRKMKNEYDSINTATELKEYLYKDNKPINFDPSNALNSQDLPEILKLNFAVSIISKDLMFEQKSILGKKPFLFKVDEFEG